jgi:predicted type IV restriction endonuclease
MSTLVQDRARQNRTGVHAIRPAARAQFEEQVMNVDYMWVDISNWEFGRMHEELRALSALGWEVDGVVDDVRPQPTTGGRSDAVNLRLRRLRKY